MNTEINILTLLEESCTAVALLGMAAEKRRNRIAEMISRLPEDSETVEGLYGLLAQSQTASERLNQQLLAICHVREVMESDEDILQSVAPEFFSPVMV